MRFDYLLFGITLACVGVYIFWAEVLPNFSNGNYLFMGGYLLVGIVIFEIGNSFYQKGKE